MAFSEITNATELEELSECQICNEKYDEFRRIPMKFNKCKMF